MFPNFEQHAEFSLKLSIELRLTFLVYCEIKKTEFKTLNLASWEFITLNLN